MQGAWYSLSFPERPLRVISPLHFSRDLDAAYQLKHIFIPGVQGAAGEVQAMAGDAGQDGLDVFRQRHAATGDEGPGTGRSEQGKGRTRAESVNEFRAVSRGLDQALHVVK